MCQRLETFFEKYAPGLDAQTIDIYCALSTKGGQLGKDEFYLSDSDLSRMSGVSSRNTLKKRLHLLKELAEEGKKLATWRPRGIF